MAASPEIRTFLCRSDNIGVLLRDPATGACAAIDVPEAAPMLKILDETGWKLTDILVTHRHGDHVEGIPEVKAKTGAKVTAPKKAEGEVPEVDRWVSEGDAVTVGELKGVTWETPGHCRDHVTYHFAEPQLLFAGDVVFTLGCGRVMESPPETLWRSLSRYLPLPDETKIFSGHDYVLSNAKFALAADPDNANLKERAKQAEKAKADGTFLVPTTLGVEKATNPFLRAGEPALARSVKMEAGSDPAAVFVALREWKNRF